LESKGYVLVVSNVSPNDWAIYEDWWCHPDLVKNIESLKSIAPINVVEKYFHYFEK